MISTVGFDIEKVKESQLAKVDFDNLPFGKLFSDHMFVATFEDGKWSKGKIQPYQNFTISPANSTLHYGQTIFEGIKAEYGVDGNIRVFRPDMNAVRMNESAERMCMPTIPEDLFLNAIKELIALDKNWVPKTVGGSLYIRPFMFASDAFIGLRPSENYVFSIFTCPVGPYYGSAVKVKVEESYTRAASGGTGAAKTAGNYAASMYPARLAQNAGYDQLLWTDAKEHKYIEESGTMNVMFRIGDDLYTPASSDTILNSVTRQCAVQIARDNGITVHEGPIEVAKVVEAQKNGTLKEAFGTGTAATIAPIELINFRGEDLAVSITDNEYSKLILDTISDIKSGKNTNYPTWTMLV
tara:strand:- start:26133 stop:27194 length:1062 start_codon:yes stop_codon:yes gene_type:complete